MPPNRLYRDNTCDDRLLHPKFSRLHLFAALYYWIVYSSLASPTNITVEDTDPSIIYRPPELWHSSSEVCPTCLIPDFGKGTYHNGTNIVSSSDVTQKPAPADAEEEHEGDGDSGQKGKGKGKSGSGGRSTSLRRDQINSNDLTVEFQFNGTAVYIFCIQPLGAPLSNTAPTDMNLTFHIDDEQQGNFLHKGSDNAPGYLLGVNVFKNTSLTEGLHSLRVNVGPDSVFLLDNIVYTRMNQNAPETTPLAADIPNPSESTDSNAKHHKIGTFVGAIVGSVGVLALIAFGLAYSIIKRRRNYDRRERLESDNNASSRPSASDDSPRDLAGPRPFVPRFFPGTHTSADPPSYFESISTSSDTGSRSADGPAPTAAQTAVPAALPIEMRPSSFVTLPVTYNAHLANRRDASYTDIPSSSSPLTVKPKASHSSLSLPQSDLQVTPSESEEVHESDALVTDPLISGPAQSAPDTRLLSRLKKA